MGASRTRVTSERKSLDSQSVYAYLIVAHVVSTLLSIPVVLGSAALSDLPQIVFVPVMAGIMTLGAAVIALYVAFPVLLYLDSKRCGQRTDGWEPNSKLWAIGGGIGYVLLPLQPMLGLLYLYKRHQHVPLL